MPRSWSAKKTHIPGGTGPCSRSHATMCLGLQLSLVVGTEGEGATLTTT